MAIEYKKAITFTKDSTLYGHNSLDEGGFPADAGNGKVSQVLDLAENQTVDTLKQSITITVDSDNTLLYHFNIAGESVATFTVPSDKFLKSVSYDTSTRELVFTFVTSEGENTVRVDMSALVDTYTAGNGLALSNNVFSIKIKGTETRLVSASDGLSIDLSDIIALIDTERTQRQNTYSDLDARIVVIENKFADIDNAITVCTTKANEAAASATQASGYATTASEKAAAAASSASLASTYATNANTYKTEAETAKTDAQTYASNASASATNAKTSEINAKTSETKASTSEANAKTSETNAKTSETNAKTSETNAGSSASSASTSASNASGYATTASEKATEASASASDAESSKDNARLWAISETIVDSEDYSSKYYANKAKTSEATASTKATEASESATSASTYKDEAESARDLAKQYRDEAETLSQSLCYFRKQTYAVSASAGATSITIPSEAQYRSGADILFVHNKGVYLKEGTDYTKTDTGIELTNALEVATTIEIDILRAVSTDSQSYDLLKGDKGTSVTSVEQTTTSTEDAGTNIVTVTLSDNTSSEFSIKNGSKGSKGDKGDKGDKGATYTQAELLDLIYPIGSIYISVNNVSPGSFIGGTWTQLNEGEFLVNTKTASLLDTPNAEELPNITGTINDVMMGGSLASAGVFKSTSLSKYGAAWKTGSGADCIKFIFKASDSSSVYKDSGKVLPKSRNVSIWKRIS